MIVAQRFTVSCPLANILTIRMRQLVDSCYGGPNTISNTIDYAMHRSRSHDAVVRVYDDAGNVIGTHEQSGEFVEQ